MHPFYIIRHAQSRANFVELEAIKAGQDPKTSRHIWDVSLTDPRLTPFGLSQATLAQVKSHTLPVRKVLVSPLKRTLQTCYGLFGKHPMRPSISVCPFLTEQLGTISEASLLTREADPEFAFWDWSLFHALPSVYWQFDVVTAPKFQSLRERFKDLGSFLGITSRRMEELYPDWMENPQEMTYRFEKIKALLKEELKLGPVALVGHQSYFKQFTLTENGTAEVLDNCEIRQQILK